MDLSPFSPFGILSAFLIPFFITILFLPSILRKTDRKPPEAGGGWPLIGHLHLLGGPRPPHITLGKMADKYGPIFTIKLGVHRVLVVSNSETAKECLGRHDKAFASRPRTAFMKLMGYNCAMFGFAPYGPYWLNIRKIVTVELLSKHRLQMFKHVRESEIKASLLDLHQLWTNNRSNNSNNVRVDMKSWFADVTLNVILRIIVGNRSSGCNIDGRDQHDSEWKKVLRDFFLLSGKFVISDALPFLRWLDIGGDMRAMKKTAEKLDRVVDEWLNEHKRKRASHDGKKSEEDFMDTLLSIYHDTEQQDADTITKATCLSLILAASDTSTAALTWALSLLLNNRGALAKAQEELDIHVGKDRLLEESDVENLVYLQAIIKETMRLYPGAPLNLVHESTEDCKVSGCHVPAGTWLFVNIFKIHRDPRVWSEPDLDPGEFRPERFLTTHKKVDVKGQHFELIPFSSGRRMCPGASFALQVMHLTLAALLHEFEFATPLDGPIDMTESVGLTNLKATPLEVFITPRLPAHCYQLN